MNSRTAALAVGLAAGWLGLTGCAGKTRYPNYYVLNLRPPVAPPTKFPILRTVAVREFRAPGFLTSGPIVYRQSPERLDYYAYHHWAEDPRRTVTTAMIRDLQASGIFQSVDMFDGRGSPDYVLTGTLDHLEELDNGTSVSTEVGLSARLLNVSTGEVIWQGTSSRTAKVDQRSVSAVVAEMSSNLGGAVEELVSSMQNRLSKPGVGQ
jgi:cholesterol transport system auxiliary component